MSEVGDAVREQETEDFCRMIAEKITKYPRASRALKELGADTLEGYKKVPGQMSDNFKYWPDWFKKYQDIFCA